MKAHYDLWLERKHRTQWSLFELSEMQCVINHHHRDNQDIITKKTNVKSKQSHKRDVINRKQIKRKLADVVLSKNDDCSQKNANNQTQHKRNREDARNDFGKYTYTKNQDDREQEDVEHVEMRQNHQKKKRKRRRHSSKGKNQINDSVLSLSNSTEMKCHVNQECSNSSYVEVHLKTTKPKTLELETNQYFSFMFRTHTIQSLV